MDWLGLGFVFSVVYALYMFQQIKITLKDAGYHVEYFTGWVRDYQRFKQMIAKEKDGNVKLKHQKILTGLYVSLGGITIIGTMLLRRYFGF